MFIWITDRHDQYGTTLHIASRKDYFDQTVAVASPSTHMPIGEITPEQNSSMEFIQFVEAGRKAGIHICFCDEA
jgi:hypothetical protein